MAGEAGGGGGEEERGRGVCEVTERARVRI